MNIITKILKGDPRRISRFHDLRGRYCGMGNVLRLPYLLYWSLLSKFGFYRALPWIPPAARRKLELLADRSWNVIECGSGSSTIWWASRVAGVVSLETDRRWFERTSRRIGGAGAGNVQLHYVSDYEPLIRANIGTANLLVIDGYSRDVCARLASELVDHEMYIYLDNTDFAAVNGEFQAAEASLLADPGRVLYKEYFHGIPPGLVAPTEGLLVKLCPRSI